MSRRGAQLGWTGWSVLCAVLGCGGSQPGVQVGAAQAGASAASGSVSPPSAAGTQARAGAGAAGSAGVRAAVGGGAAPAADGGRAEPALDTDAGPALGSSIGGAGAGGAAAAIGGGAGTGATSPSPDPKFLVPATGPCPTLGAGYVMFHPDGVERRVLLYMSDAAKTLDGPLLFSWHSTIPTPEDAVTWIGSSVIDEIEAQGGIVAAPTTADPSQTRPWDNIPMGPQNTDGDQRLMDEIVACASSQVGIDVRRIHAIGMSAGGLKTAQVSLRRSGYVASVVVYSGGLSMGEQPPDQDPSNHFAAMILYGGASDISPVDGINYTDASRAYLDLLRSQGRFGFLCNHGGGHSVPQDSQASAWRFMQDHPFGAAPEPYAMQLPSGFLRYCSLQ